MIISDYLISKYRLLTKEELIENLGEANADKEYWSTFLNATDHIPNKIIEAQALGEEVQDYTEILELRKEARKILGGRTWQK